MTSCRWWGQVAIAAVLLTTSASSTRADALADARNAVEASDYPSAQPRLEAALKAGTAGPEDLAEIHRLTGIVQAALGNAAAAEKAFGKWLALDPRGALPAGTSPKLTRPFDAASATARKKGPLQAKAETADNPPAVTLVVGNDPMKMIVGVKVYFITDGKREEVLEAAGTTRATIELGTGKRIDLRLHAVDRHGNRVVELGSNDVPIVITSTGREKPLEPKDFARARSIPGPVAGPGPSISGPGARVTPRPWYLQWWVWGGASALATGVAGSFAWRTRGDLDRLDRLNATSLSHTWQEAQDVESSARHNLLVTNLATGAAGAFAIGAALLFVTRPTRATSREHELRATLTPARGGGALVVGGQF